MANIITTISYSSEIEQFIRENNLKPSKIVQEKVMEMIESAKVSNKMIQELNRKIAFLQQTIEKQRNFIEAKGLMDDFIANV